MMRMNKEEADKKWYAEQIQVLENILK